MALGWLCVACGVTNAPQSRFCGDCGASFGSSERGSRGAAPTAERRQLTVMFCDMVGSTALGARLDPEDLREVIAAYHGCVSSQVARFSGFIARYMGDGVLVYFGFPAANEDDAERAVRAGLAVTEAVGRLNTIAGPPGTLRTRVGIATGLVVVGDLIGGGLSQEQTVVGDTPNLANRMQSLAAPGTLVISDSTRRLTAGLFDYEEIVTDALKGYSTEIHAWTVLRENAIESRFEALRDDRRGPILGRDEELTLLLRRWEQVRQGGGRVILLTGEAGIGKSRLTAALEERLHAEQHIRLRYLCSPHHSDSALYPVIGLLTRVAGFERTDDTATKLSKLQALLARGAPPPDDFAMLADLLSLPAPSAAELAALTPSQRKEKTFAALLRHLDYLTRLQPLLMVIEDIHWADATTLELLERLIDQIEPRRMLVLMTSRPGQTPSWVDRPRVSVHLLNRLDRRQAGTLIDGVAGDRPLPDKVRDQIIAHADGIPLFVEELTKTMLETSPQLAEPGAPSPIMTRSPVVVPSSLQASLMARLDRLAEVKEVAQMGAVIGREFSFQTFQSVFQMPPDRLESGLRALVEADLFVGRGQPPDAVYSFRHALVQDAAYSTLLRDRRRTLHARVAQALGRDSAMDAEPELLAYHFTEAGMPDKAIDYHQKAADRAMARSAVAEMVSHLHRGLGLLSDQPDTAENRRRELTLQIALGRGLIDSVSSASDTAHTAFKRARELCLELGETDLLVPVLYGLQVYHFTRGEPDIVISYAREILALATSTGDRRALLLGERVGGSAYFLLGKLAESRASYENLLLLYDSQVDGGMVSDTTRHPMVAGYTFLSICLTVMGYPEQGLATAERGLRQAEEVLHAISLVFGLRRGCIQHMLMRDVARTRRRAAELLTLSVSYETFKGEPEGTLFESWAILHETNDDGAHRRLLLALQQLDDTKNWAFLPFLMTAAADLTWRRGDQAGAMTLLNRATELIALTGERWCEAEVLRLRACIPPAETPDRVALLRQSLALAAEQGARLWELRSAVDLARIWRDDGLLRDAADLLGPICGWFTEGFDLPDFIEAKALLDSVTRAEA